MSAYDFSVEYKPGASHKVPDELSRMLTTGYSDLPSSEEDDSFVPCLLIETEVEDGLLPTPVYPRASPLIQVTRAAGGDIRRGSVVGASRGPLV